MKHSKNKWISSALVLSLSVGLSACGNANDKKKGTNGSDKTASTQWSKGDPCPKAVADEYLASETPDTDNMSLDEKIAVHEKAKSLTEEFHKKYSGKPGCKVEITSRSGEKIPFEIEFLDQEQLDNLMKARSAHIEDLKKKRTTGGGTTTSPTSDSKKECTPEIQAEAQRLSDSLSDIHVTRNTMLLELKGLDAKSPSYAADWESTVDMGMQSLSYQMSKYIPEEDKFAVDHKGSSACIVVIKKADGKEEKLTQTFPSTDEDAEARVTDRECEFTQLEKDTWKEIQKISDEKSGKKETPAAPVTKSDPEAATSLESSAEVTKQSTTPVTTTPSSQSDDAAAPAKKAAAPAPAKKAVAPAPAKKAAAPAPAKKTKILPPLCESSLIAAVKQFRKQAVEPFNNIENLNKAEVIKRTDEFLDHTAAFLRDYIGHHDCLMVKNKPGSLEEFPKSEKELQEIFSEAKEQFKKLAEKDLKDLKNTLKAMASEDN